MSSSLQRCHRRHCGRKGRSSDSAACPSIPTQYNLLYPGHLAGPIGGRFLPVSRLSLLEIAGGFRVSQPAQLGPGVLCPTSLMPSRDSSKARAYTSSSTGTSPRTSSRTRTSTNTSYSISSGARVNDRTTGKSRASTSSSSSSNHQSQARASCRATGSFRGVEPILGHLYQPAAGPHSAEVPPPEPVSVTDPGRVPPQARSSSSTKSSTRFRAWLPALAPETDSARTSSGFLRHLSIFKTVYLKPLSSPVSGISQG